MSAFVLEKCSRLHGTSKVFVELTYKKASHILIYSEFYSVCDFKDVLLEHAFLKHLLRFSQTL